MKYAKLDSTKFGLAAGIVGAILVFLTTLNGLWGYSGTHMMLSKTSWGMMGYSIGPLGILVGAILGFIYAFLIAWAVAAIYNKLI